MNILLTSVGRRTYLIKYFQEVMEGIGEVHVANSTAQTPVFTLTKHSVVTPLIYDECYIPFLLDYCKNNTISAIISLFDPDLPILAENREKFEKEGVFLIVPSKEVVDICNDKWKTYLFCKKNGIRVPKTYVSLSEAQTAIDIGELHYPVILKPRWGMGSIGIITAEKDDELQVLYAKGERDIFKTYQKYESNGHDKELILVQEMLQGQEYGLDVINNLKGEYQNTIVKKKYAIRAGETDCAETIENSSLRNLGEKLSGILHHIGNLDVDVFLVDDIPYILDMNARFGGGYPFSHVAGVNLPLAIVKWLLNEPVNQHILVAKSGVLSHKDITITNLRKE